MTATKRKSANRLDFAPHGSAAGTGDSATLAGPVPALRR